MNTDAKLPPLVTETGRDVSKLIDAYNAAEDAAKRGNAEAVRDNLRTCFDLAHRIERRRTSARARRLFRKAGR